MKPNVYNFCVNFRYLFSLSIIVRSCLANSHQLQTDGRMRSCGTDEDEDVGVCLFVNDDGCQRERRSTINVDENV